MSLGILLCIMSSLLIVAAKTIPLASFDENNPMLGPYHEGDILNPPMLRSGVPELSKRWRSKTLVYRINPGFSEKELKLIADAMNEIRTKTCIKFRQANFWDRDYVLYKKVPQGCNAHVGKVGRQQLVNLENGCFNNGHVSVMHETMHALGFGHEHNRPDRDNFVHIYYDRVKPEYRFAFNKDSSYNTFGVPYDYESIMHYPKDAFATRPYETTIAPKNPGATIGQSQRLSTKDVEKLKKMYNC